VARDEAARGGRKAIEREQRAREELDQLKARRPGGLPSGEARRGGAGGKDVPADDAAATPPTVPAAKPRRL
jgi:hypothetical protein